MADDRKGGARKDGSHPKDGPHAKDGNDAGKKPSGSGSERNNRNDKGPETPDVMAIAGAVLKELSAVGTQLKSAFEQVAEDAQYKIDHELAKALSKHPELYAEIRKTMRQVKRTVDAAAEAIGMEKP